MSKSEIKSPLPGTFYRSSSPDRPPFKQDGDDVSAEETGKDVAQQVAAMRPQYVARDQVPGDVVENERRIAEQMTREEGKPEQAIGRIVEGRLGAFFKDVVLAEQAFIKDPKKTIKQVLSEQGVTVQAFARFQVGQAG